MNHIIAGKNRIENLWARGTDYCQETVDLSRKINKFLHLDLDLTGNCKLACGYCDRTPDRFNKISNRSELSTAERIDLITQAKELGATTIEFPGAGEPMIDPGFWQILEYVHQQQMVPVVFTSGYHLNEETVDRLYNNGATVFVKYNHRNEEIQDRIVRKKGYGSVVKKGINLLIEKGFNNSIPTRLAIDLVVTASHQDLSEVCDIFRWCRQNNIHCYISTLIPEGLADRSSQKLERDRCNQLIAMIQKIDSDEFQLNYTSSRPLAGGYKCRQVYVGLFVNLFGEVYDCNGLGRFLGHTKTHSLKDIWMSKFSQKIRTPIQDGFCVLRERVWDGIEATGFNRKVEEYVNFSEENGPDPIVESGLEYTGFLSDSKLKNLREKTKINLNLIQKMV